MIKIKVELYSNYLVYLLPNKFTNLTNGCVNNITSVDIKFESLKTKIYYELFNLQRKISKYKLTNVSFQILYF
jgi:hypothetical protein